MSDDNACNKSRSRRWTLARRKKRKLKEHCQCHHCDTSESSDDQERVEAPRKRLVTASVRCQRQGTSGIEPSSVVHPMILVSSNSGDSQVSNSSPDRQDAEFKKMVSTSRPLSCEAGPHHNESSPMSSPDDSKDDYGASDKQEHDLEKVCSPEQNGEEENNASSRSSDDEFSYGDNLRMAFLEEEPDEEAANPFDYAGDGGNNEHRPNDPENPDPNEIENPDEDPDDPDEPNDHHEPDDENHEPSSSEDEGGTFCFDSAALNTPLEFGRRHTRREVLLLILATAIKNNWTYEALIDTLNMWNVGIGREGLFPKSKRQLWRLLRRTSAGICKHAYCPHCLNYIGKLQRLQGPQIHCGVCRRVTPRNKIAWFISVSLKKQLEHFLATPGVAAKLRHRHQRQKRREDSMEDIYDGQVYTRLVENGSLLPSDFSYVFNTDGFNIFKHGTMSVWVLLVRLNELPPELQQKNLFLAGVWINKKEPNMNTFLIPFVSQANHLSGEGIVWRPDGINEVRSRFLPICCCVDAPARCKVMNHNAYSGYWGCVFCTHRGVQLAGSGRYPILPYEDLPVAMDRTHQSITEAMNMNQFHQGHKGPSEIMLLDNFDMAEGQGLDDLHPFYEGITAQLVDLLIPLLGEDAAATLQVIDFRMRQVRTPIQMARKWISIEKRTSWKGSQWGYFIKYLAVICFLNNNLPQIHVEHVSMLSYIMFVISQDSVAPADLNVCLDYCERFERLFQEYHGVGNMEFNIHVLRHAVKSVRNFGPTWTTSTFNFESWNRKLGKFVTAARGALDQIVNRHMLKLYVHTNLYRDDVSETIKIQMSHLLFHTPRKVAEEVGNNTYVLDRATARQATQEETDLLLQQGIDSRDLREYERVIVKGVEYRTRFYHPDTLSDNSCAYTWDDTFVTINKILVVRGNDNENICGVLVDLHEVDHPIRFAHHIAHLTGDDELAFVLVDRLRVPAIKMFIQDDVYVVPMSSCHEID